MSRREDGAELAGRGALTPPGGRGADRAAWYAPGWADALGDRLHLFDASAPPFELLRLSPRLTAVPGFADALRDRIDRLKSPHPTFATVRGLTTIEGPPPQLAVASVLPRGKRLSSLLDGARAAGRGPDPREAMALLQHVLTALAALHACGPDVAHGLLGPDRIVIAPDGSVTITEHVFGAALEALGPEAERLREELGLPRLHATEPGTQRADVARAALLAVAVLIDRTLRAGEDDRAACRLLDDALATGGLSGAAALRAWIGRALGFDGRAFASAREAEAALAASSGVAFHEGGSAGLLPDAFGVPAFVPEPVTQEGSAGRTSAEGAPLPEAETGDAVSPAGAGADVEAATLSTVAADQEVVDLDPDFSLDLFGSEEPPDDHRRDAIAPGEPAVGSPPVSSEPDWESWRAATSELESPARGGPESGSAGVVPDVLTAADATTATSGQTAVEKSTATEFTSPAAATPSPDADADPDAELKSLEARLRSPAAESALPRGAPAVEPAAGATNVARAGRVTPDFAPLADAGEFTLEAPDLASPASEPGGRFTMGSGGEATPAPAPPSRAAATSRRAIASLGQGGAAAVVLTGRASRATLRATAATAVFTGRASRAAMRATAAGASRAAAVPRDRLLLAGSILLLCAALVTAGLVVMVARPPAVATEDVPEPPVPADDTAVPEVVEPTSKADDAPRRPQATTGRTAAPSRPRASSRTAAAPAAAPVEPPPPDLPRTPDGRLAGWVAVDAPIALRLSLEGRFLEQSQDGRFTLPAGRHTIELESEPFGYRTTRVVTVGPGQLDMLRIEIPIGHLWLDVEPWAEVLVGSEVVGRTPLRDFALPPGTHRITLRHPELGERHTTVTIREGARTTLTLNLGGK